MIKSVSEALQLPAHRVKNVIDLLQNGATIPFIARYRKEATGNLDEQQIEQIQKELKKHEDLTKRKEYIRSVIE
ncbi:MAG: RNA-binding transcriptional accessory protein, partial [Bacteroidetes bacterium]|nr:RNA-binding transcriptional accessory protein [Bacteroidota bacterium]